MTCRDADSHFSGIVENIINLRKMRNRFFQWSSLI